MFMQQKIVVKVSMNSDKQTRKALKIAVSISGVESASFVKDQLIAVTGDAIDSIELTTLLTKRIGYTEELLSVGLVEESKPPIEAPMQVDPYHYIMKCSKM
ncbi:hypothetical protein Hanom_Chr04g00385201 [Helianthus anomalus]